MKEFAKKVIVVLVLLVMLINSQLLLVISSAVEAVENIIDESKVNSVYEITLEKYVNYSTDSDTGVLTQFDLKTGIEYGEGQEYKPLSATEILLNLPKIEGEHPESIEIIGKSTKATNGSDTAKDFNYVYNKENGEMKIVALNNQDENGNIYSDKVDGARDEYTVICYYSSNCYNDKNVQRNLEFSGAVQANIADDNETKKITEISQNYAVTENISGLISTEVETSDIYNGYINSNKQNGTQNTTEYTENMKINISYKEISEELTVETDNKFINKENKEVETDEIVYKSVKINKQNVLDILGEEGKLRILNTEGQVLGEINKDTEAKEDGAVEINYEQEQTEIIIKITKPEKTGTIEIENQKTIKEKMTEIENKKISNKNTIKCENNVQEKDEETGEIIREYTEEIYNYENTKEIEIKESETKIDVNLDKTEWTNNVQNDITITATLVTNGPQYNLFKNPVIEIKLPEEVEKVILGDVSLLYDDNLSIKNVEIIDRDNCKVIRIELNGIQNEYISNSMINGANIIIPATVIIKKNINSVDTTINMTYSNESGIINDYEKNGLGSKQCSIKIVENVRKTTYSLKSTNTSISTEIANPISVEGLDIEMYAQVGSDVLEDGDTVYEDEIITYTMKITNKSNSSINNVKLEGIVPEGTTYVTKDGSEVNPDRDETEDIIRNDLYIKDNDKKEETFLINSISVGETITKTYKVMVNDLEDNTEKQINSMLDLYVNNKKILNKTINSVVKNAKLSVGIYPSRRKFVVDSQYGYEFFIDVTNKTDEDIDNVYIESKLENVVNIYQCLEEYNFDENSRILKIEVGKLSANSTKQVSIIISATNFIEGKYEYSIPVNVVAYGENTDIYRSDTESEIAYCTSVSIVQSSPTEGEKLKTYDEIKYKVTVTNEGLENTYVTVIDNMPEGIDAIKVEYESYEKNEGTDKYEKVIKEEDLKSKLESETNDCEIGTYILAENSIDITITACVEAVSEITEVENVAAIRGVWIKSKISNSIKNIILPYGYKEPDVPVDPDNPDKPVDPDTPVDPGNPDNPDFKEEYSINGVVWVDENKDGKRDEDEELLGGITVKLFDANTNSIVTDKNNNTIKTNTDKNGKYEFKGISKGKYLVLFEYDTKTYEITTYQKNGTSAYLNSDAIKKEVSIDGNTKVVGITDILTISNTNLKNIDMGLIKNPVFDFRLDKYVSKVTVSNDSGTKEYEYNNSQLAKVEIPAKQINNTEVKIEYKIVVTNEGEVAGYVNELIDYLPSELQFDIMNNNGEWSKNGNSELINTSLSTEKINPRESKEITLVLSKKMTDNSTGKIVNEAKIYKINNTSNLSDINSENDYSKADIIISIKTGIVTYIIYIMIILVMLLIIFVLMKNKKIKQLLMICFIISTFVIIAVQQNYSNARGEPQLGATFRFGPANLKGHIEKENNEWKWRYTSAHEDAAALWCMDPGSSLHDNYKYWLDASTRFEGSLNDGNPMSLDQFKNYIRETYGTYTTGESSVQITLPFGDNKSDGNLENEIYSAFYTQIPSISNVIIINNNAKLLSDSNLVGPFKIMCNVENIDLTNINISLENFKINSNLNTDGFICNNDGTVVTKLIDVFNSDFYICIPTRNVANISFKVKLTSEKFSRAMSIDVDIYRSKDKGSTGNTAQSLMAFTINYGDDEISASSVEKTVVLTGNLEITKKDSDTGANLPGTTFTVTGPIGTPTPYTYTATTGGDGKARVENLLPGTYTVTETGAPNGYNLSLQGNKTQTISIVAGEDSPVTFTNKQYGNLLVTKKDADTGQTQIGGQRLANIKFKLFVVKNGQRQYLNGNASSSNTTHYNYSDFNVSESNKAGAKTFVTNSNAQFAIQNLPVFEGPNPITYYIEEYELPSNLQEYYDVKSDLDVVTIGNGKTVNKDILNKQQYIQISGYVWDDVADESKQTLKNDLYEAPETLVKDITVRLKHANGATIDTKVTNQNGAYKFNKVKISELSNYYIEFEYNGLKYTNVKVNKNANNGSKASEKATDRTSFNNLYSSITGGNAKGNTTTGYSKNENGTITNNLTYKNGKYSSSLVQNTEYTVASASGSVSAQNGSVGVSMKADTNTAGYTLRWTAGTVEITNVNLGITAREQPDMAISTDLNSIDLTLNGYSHTYTYNKRLKATGIDIFSEIEKWNKTEKEQQGQASNGYLRTYTRSIYKNYVYASGITGDGALVDEDKLQVYLTYKIVVKNESSSLYMSANEIVNYYDKTLDIVESWYDNSNKDKVNVTWTSKDEKNGYNEFRTDSLKDVKIEHGQSITIYIKTKKNNVISWTTQNEINDKTYNVTEIASYSSYTRSGNNYQHYAGIDRDSAPDNIIPGRGQEYINRYEDDTDAAPVLEITFEEPRTISGYVFEDIAKYEDGSDETELHTGRERKGDGQYNAGQDGYVENVKVELVKISGDTEPDTTAYIYPKAVTDQNFNAEEAVDITTSETTEDKPGRGYYEFVGVIPDEYYLKYTYGDGSVIYKKVGGTVDVTTQDYKSTIITSDTIKKAYRDNEFKVDGNPQWYQDETIKGYSAAVDDYETRTTINDALNEITYKVRTGYEDKEGNYADLQTMTARTPNMSIAIENTDNETTDGIDDEGKRISLYDNINFGIIERPRKSIETTKEIKYIRLILANGQVLAEGDPRTDSIRYVTYPEGGNLKIEVDNEIIEGATLEVTYEIIIENKSELDYDTQRYYKYGEIAGAKPVVLTINSVIDHMDEELTTTYTYDNSSGWKAVKVKELRDKGLISNDVYAAIQNNHNILVKEDCDLKITPLEGENIERIEVNASKLLSTSKEMIYNNYAEVLKVSNSVGRFYGQINEDSSNKWKLTIPGNFNPNNPKNSPEDDTDKVIITIIPPTGQDMNQYVVLSVIGIGCLSLLVGGIVLIKKKVLG